MFPPLFVLAVNLFCFACQQLGCPRLMSQQFRKQYACRQRCGYQQYIRSAYLFDSHDYTVMIVKTAHPVQDERMDKIDKQGICRKQIKYIIAFAAGLYFRQESTEKNERSGCINKSLRAELMVGIGQIQETVTAVIKRMDTAADDVDD